MKNKQDIFSSYNNFKEEFKEELEVNYELDLQYKILFRYWSQLDNETIIQFFNKNTKVPKEENGEIIWEETNITFKDLIEWNYGYYCKALGKEELGQKLEISNEVGYYTDIVKGEKSIKDLFFLGVQPILDVEYYEKQLRVSKKLKEKNMHLVLDEVGTGKTVTALYCARDIISQKSEQSKILIICPNNKKNEWLKDVQRQLGLYAHLVNADDSNKIYNGEFKKIFFKKNEPYIFIMGQNKNQIKQNLSGNDNSFKWDLVIIDEAHLCFDNYTDIRAEKALMLTATPIIVKIKGEDKDERKLQQYIDKLNKITNSNENIVLNDLINPNKGPSVTCKPTDYVTQLFREDLGIVAKNRIIKFIECNRMENRREYQNLLYSVKGAMTELIYEQDDDYLLHGIFEKFRADIERANYLIGERPEIENIEDNKYNTLEKYLNDNRDKSYIIFFNSKYPANCVYNKLIDSKYNFVGENSTIAKKYGGDCDVSPKDNSITTNNIFDAMLLKIKDKKRVIFITTGATGGTGLNLGDFDGVINYELPFTSIELEQRFGRVDRVNNNESTEKEMIFLINKDENPMLRYSTLKINSTSKYMPIRNTVLFHPEFVKINTESLEKELEECKLTDSEKTKINDFMLIRNQYNENLELINKIVALEKHIIQKGNLEEFEEDATGIEDYSKFIIFKDNVKCLLNTYNKNRKLQRLKNDINQWTNLLGVGSSTDIEAVSDFIIEEDEEQDVVQEGIQEEVFVDSYNNIRSNEFIISNNDKSNEISGKQSTLTLGIDKFNDLYNNLFNQLKGLTTVVNDENIVKAKVQVATGLFYIDEHNNYKKQTVEEFRNEECRKGILGV